MFNNAEFFCMTLGLVTKFILVPSLCFIAIGFVLDLIDVTLGERVRERMAKRKVE